MTYIVLNGKIIQLNIKLVTLTPETEDYVDMDYVEEDYFE